MQTNMEESFSTLIKQQRDGRDGPKPKAKGVPDDLTNLNWVAGIPVPINTSVSPPESRTKKLFFGSPSAKDILVQHQEADSPTTPTFVVPARTKSLKTPLPTYKIVVKDQTHESCCYSPSSPEKRGSVILANIVSSGNGYHENSNLEPEKIIIEDDECIDLDKESESVTAYMCTAGARVRNTQDKPNCSYTCLIGMALKASIGCLPVNAIYQYIEREFPYFINAPDGWKNSVRHNLSLNPIFRKVNREGWTGKKGYLWKVCPDKQDVVDKEILRFLGSTGKKLGEFTAPTKSTRASSSKYKQRSKKLCGHSSPIPATPIFCSRCTRIVSPTPQESSSSDDSYTHPTNSEEMKKYSAEVQEEVTSSNVQLKPGSTLTQAAFDTDKSPSKYIGVKSPPQDPKDIAKEMFGLCPNSENLNAFYSPLNYGGPFIPFYTQPGQFGMPFENFEQVVNSSSTSSSDASPMAGHLFPHYPQYAMPMPFPYILGSQYPQVYNCNPYDAQEGKDSGATHKLVTMPPPMSVKVLTSSGDVVETGDACERRNANGKHHSSGDFSYACSDVASLSSPLKRMKVMDANGGTDDSISAYFADVSANSTCSDDDAEENEEVSNIMSLLLKSKQGQHTEHLPLAGLYHISTREKLDLEQLAGTSDLDSLLNKGLESLSAKDARGLGCGVQSPPPLICTEAPELETKYIYSEDCGGVTAMDMHDISAKITSTQDDSYYLPSLDSLLTIGDDTIVTIKAAMNLDIQGVVEIATEESCRDIENNTAIHSSTKADEIQIN